MVLDYSDYRIYLKSVLLERQKSNPSYSLRSFAAQLGVTQPALSQVFSGKKNLSSETAIRIAARLGLSEKEIEYFRIMVELGRTKDPELRSSLLSRAQALNSKRAVTDLSIEVFSVISDWYHLAIKNMIELSDFDFTPAHVAKRLGISKNAVELAIDRLLRLEMIEIDPQNNNKYRVVKDNTVVRSNVPNGALRKFHRQMLQKAAESLETQSPKEKIVGSETFAFSEAQMTEANELVEEFFNKMTALSKKAKRPTQVYHLGIQFFNLTKGKI